MLDVPSSDVLVRLSKALDLKPSYFLGRDELLPIKWVASRTMHDLSETEMAQVKARAADALERCLAVEEILGQERHPFRMPAGAPYGVSAVDAAEIAAEQVRKEWQLGQGPIAHVASLLEDHGVRIAGFEYGDGFDAVALHILDGQLAVALNTSSFIPGDRQRFTMCHELGHFILDIGRQLNCELTCHRFAGALLAPREAVIRELGETRSRIGVLELHALKHEYGLSMQGWLHRALEVGVIPQAEYDRMRASFRRLGWTKREPGAQVPPELPRRMEQLIGRAYAERVISRSRAAELLGRGLDLQPV